MNIDWDNIDRVFLDMDGTLLDLGFDNHFWQVCVPQRYAEKHGLTPEQASAELVPRFRAREKTLAWYCIDYWSRDLGMDIAALKHEMRHHIRLLPHAHEFLLAIRASGRLAILVTNAHPATVAIKLKKTGIEKMLDEIVSTHRFGVPKENPSFWKKLRRRIDYDAQRTLLVDDGISVLEAARTAGLKHLLAITRPDSGLPNRKINGFPCARDFGDILPIPPGRGLSAIQ